MAAEPIVLYDDGHHKCLMFDSLVTGEGVQSNQFLIVDGKHEALIDPGGDLTYTPLSVAASRYMNIRDMDFVFASHQDPDILLAPSIAGSFTPARKSSLPSCGPASYRIWCPAMYPRNSAVVCMIGLSACRTAAST